MTAPLVFASLETASVGSFFSACAAESRPAASRCGKRDVRQSSHLNTAQPSTQSSDPAALNLLQSRLLESLQQGVMVTSRSLQPLYWNAKARLLCQQLVGDAGQSLALPMAVSEVCHRLKRQERLSDRPLVLECQATTGQTIRLSARWLDLTGDREPVVPTTAMQSDSHVVDREPPSHILIMLENCNELLQEELRIERKKYDLTEREAEVWMLLRQEYSYQDVARLLQISLNTVKTHVKNVYAKKRNCQGREKFWCGD